MKIITVNKNTARIKTRASLIKLCCENPNNFRLTDEEQSAFTYAKFYYKGGGWWRLCGYSADGRDVQQVLSRLLSAHFASIDVRPRW